MNEVHLLKMSKYAFDYIYPLYELIDNNREHLSNLKWAKNATASKTMDFVVDMALTKHEDCRLILFRAKVAGVITVRTKPHQYAQLGFWLGHEFRRRGVMSTALKEMLVIHNRNMTAIVRDGNTACRELLLKHKFKTIRSENGWGHFLWKPEK